MSSDGKDPPPTATHSRSALYANLLSNDSPSGSTISRAPVVFSQANGRDGQQDELTAARNTALRFQPTKRPLPGNKTKQKPAFSKIQASQAAALPSSDSADTAAPALPAPATKSTLADWTAGDDDGFYVGEKRQRGGRKKRKKNKEAVVVVQDWDDIYDPSRPNVYDDYVGSEEHYREIREWKDHLYRHRLRNRRRSSELSDYSDRPSRSMDRSFAPPPNLSFAPPTTLDDDGEQNEQHETDDMPPPQPPAADVPIDESGEDAYARRMRLSGMQPPSAASPPAPPPPPPDEPPPPAGTISRAPVRYQLPAAPTGLPASEAELQDALRDAEDNDENEPSSRDDAAATAAASADGDDDDGGSAPARSSRPGQRGFAQRLMSKYGWTQGSGLGAAERGIVAPLRVQVEKRKKRSDAEGGGFIGPAGKGRIIGPRHGKSKDDDDDKNDAQGAGGEEAPALSEVVMLLGMVDGMDLDAELGDGGLMQEIGDECEEKYGRVERVFIHRHSKSASTPVFVKFTSQLSALRAVQALQGRIFNGNAIDAQYFDPEKFEAGVYE